MPLKRNIKNIAVIGLGITGKAVAHFLIKKQYTVWACDQKSDTFQQNQDLQELLAIGLNLFDDNGSLPSDIDLVVVSPGVSPLHRHYQAAKERGIEIIGEIELACRYLNNVFLGITGTNGKTTTTLLTTHILNQCHKPAIALGNIGTPLISQVDKLNAGYPKPIIVVELSSYQLETMSRQIIDAGVILNITPDHLDRYASLDDYAIAKIQMIQSLKPNSSLFVFEDVYENYKHLFHDFIPKTYGYSPSCHYQITQDSLVCHQKLEWPLPENFHKNRHHDIENIVASYALCKEMGVSCEDFLHALDSFTKPPHRIEFVRTVNNIAYYNDSKGTNLDAVIRAVQSLDQPIVLIAGGIDKGAPYTSWIPVFQNKVKGICTIGQAAQKIYQELSHHLPVYPCESLDAAVHSAIKIASPGEAILLSPGCASQDMFKDYAHRGDVFKAIVNAL